MLVVLIMNLYLTMPFLFIVLNAINGGNLVKVP